IDDAVLRVGPRRDGDGVEPLHNLLRRGARLGVVADAGARHVEHPAGLLSVPGVQDAGVHHLPAPPFPPHPHRPRRDVAAAPRRPRHVHGPAPRHELQQHDAEAVHVAAVGGDGRVAVLRRDVAQRADQVRRDVRVRGQQHQARQPEVREAGLHGGVQEDVAGLDVAVQDARLGRGVQVRQPARGAARHAEPRRPRQRAAAALVEPVVQAPVLHVRVDEQPVLAGAAPRSGTRFRCRTRDSVSTSARNSRSICQKSPDSRFTATSRPSGSVARYTMPKPPHPTMRDSSKLPVAFNTSSSVVVTVPRSPSLSSSSSLPGKSSTSVDLAAAGSMSPPLSSSSAATLALSSCRLDHERHVTAAATARSSAVPTLIAATTPALRSLLLFPPAPASAALGAHRATWMPHSKGFPSKSARENVENCPPTGTSPERLLNETSKWERKLSCVSDAGIAPESALFDRSSDSRLVIPDSSAGMGPDSLGPEKALKETSRRTILLRLRRRGERPPERELVWRLRNCSDRTPKRSSGRAPAMALPSSESSTSDRHWPNPTGNGPERPLMESRMMRTPGDASHRAAASTAPTKLFPDASYTVRLPAPISTGWVPLNALYETLNSRSAGRSIAVPGPRSSPASVLALTSSTSRPRSRSSAAGSAPRSAFPERFSARSAASPASDADTSPRSVRLGSASPTTTATAPPAAVSAAHCTPGQSQHPSSDALATGQPSTAASRPAENPRSAARSAEPHGCPAPSPGRDNTITHSAASSIAALLPMPGDKTRSASRWELSYS
ncbi:LOW QUALITY PROTEIN: hypothetical protein U9M48_025936, partial [Paspalum notatum var. saurae]